MKRLDIKKLLWYTMGLTIAFTAIVIQKIPAEKRQAVSQYIIIELEPMVVAEYESVSEKSMEDYDVTGIIMDDPIISQILGQNGFEQEYDKVALYEVTSHQQSMDGWYDFILPIFEDAEIVLYQRENSQIKKSMLETLDAAEEDNCLSQVRYQSETNHWLIFYSQGDQERCKRDREVANTETEDTETECVVGSLEGETEKISIEPSSNSIAVSETQLLETLVASTTAHVHIWNPITTVVHHDAITDQIWIEDTVAWDETVVIKEAYDETVVAKEAYDELVYGWVGICNNCGHVFQANENIGDHMEAGCWSSWHDEWRPTGKVIHHDAEMSVVHHDAETAVVHHDAVGHYEVVVIQTAWDETIVTGYSCSVCNAEK